MKNRTSERSFRHKLKHEAKVVALATLYFAIWLGFMLVIKGLILAEYGIKFHWFVLVLVGALFLAKVVIVLEHVSLGAWIRTQPVWVDVLLRTALYGLGVLVVLLLEEAFKGRHEHGGFGPSLLSVFQHSELHHVWAETICLAGALLGYNAISAVRRHLGEGGLLRLFLSPLPEASQPQPAGSSATFHAKEKDSA